MFWGFMGVALVLTLAYLLYICVIKPVKLKRQYAKLLRQQGLRVLQLPHRPYTAPVYADMFEMYKVKKDAHHTFKHVYKDYDVVVTNSLNRPEIFVVNNPNLMMEILSADKIAIMHKACKGFQMFKNMLQKGLVMVEGQEWKHRRKIISKVFNFDFISSYVPSMVSIADSILTSFEQRQKEGNKGIKVSVYDIMTQYTSNIVLTGFIGAEAMKQKIRGKSLTQTILDIGQLSVRLSQDPLVLALGPGFCYKNLRQIDRDYTSCKKELKEVLTAYVDRERQKLKQEGGKNQQENIVSALLKESMNDKNKDSQFKIDNQKLVDEIITFATAGSETTSNLLTMMILRIYEHPQVLDKLKQEINSVIKGDSDITIDNMKKLKYLDCVLNQTSRLYYAASMLFQREFIQDTTLFGIPVKKGTGICISWVPMLHDQKHFENPFKFLPERWEKEDAKEKLNMVSLTFSGGPRSCIGKYLALAQAKVMVIKFLKRYQKLQQPGIKNRAFEQQLTYHLVNSNVILTKHENQDMKI